MPPDRRRARPPKRAVPAGDAGGAAGAVAAGDVGGAAAEDDDEASDRKRDLIDMPSDEDEALDAFRATAKLRTELGALDTPSPSPSPAPAAAGAPVDDPRRDDNGYIFKPDRPAPIGRITFYKGGTDKATAYMQCSHRDHAKCCRWITLRHLPKPRSVLVDWVCAQDDFPGSDGNIKHMAAFYKMTNYQR